MTVAAQANPKALAVWFKDFHRWDFGFFRSLAWAWPSDMLFPLGTILEKKHVEVDTTPDKSTVPIIEKISFGGVVSVVGLEARSKYKGRLFWADCGDLIYSKIRVKQGSLAIVPNEFDRLAVSAEYPVYRINAKRIDSTFLVLVLKSKAFLALFEGLSHGGSTKTRIPPSEFERQLIPLPPLSQQKAIVNRWLKAQGDIRTIRWRIQEQQNEIEDCFLRDLGLEPPTKAKRGQKHFAVTWKMLDRWDVTYFRRPLFNPQSNCYPNVLLSDVVQPLSKTAQRVNPGESPNEDFNYLGMENVESITGNVKGETIRQGKTIKSTCVVFNKGLVLYGKLRPYLRKVVDCSELAFDQGVASSEFICLRPRESLVSQAWLAYYLRSAAVAEQAKIAIGARMPRISPNVLLSMCIPLPPLSVQKQIMARVAAGREEIGREKAKAERLSREINAEIEALILGTKRVG